MCGDCCGLRQIGVNDDSLKDHFCGASNKNKPLFHVGFFTLFRGGPIFPGQTTRLDAYSACNLHLMADIRTTGLRAQEHFDQDRIPYDTENRDNPSNKLLSTIFAVSSSRDNKYGALVQCNVAVQRRNASWTMYSNFQVKVLARYKLVTANIPLHRPYSCIIVSVCCDKPSPSLSESVDSLFPILSPFKFPSKNGGAYGIITRSRSAIRKTLPRQRSSAFMAGLPYKVWNAFQPEVLKQRARKAASFTKFQNRSRNRQIEPDENDCATKWSYFLCSLVPDKVEQETRILLFEQSSVIERYQLLLKIFDDFSKKTKSKRTMKDTKTDKLNRITLTKNKKKLGESKPDPETNYQDNNQKRLNIRHHVVEDLLKNQPWPCSSSNGFCRVNPLQPCKGRFKLLPPHFVGEKSDCPPCETEKSKL